jgi:hypothetical protein
MLALILALQAIVSGNLASGPPYRSLGHVAGGWELVVNTEDTNSCSILVGFDTGALMGFGFSHKDGGKPMLLARQVGWTQTEAGASKQKRKLSIYFPDDEFEATVMGVTVTINGSPMVGGLVDDRDVFYRMRTHRSMVVTVDTGASVTVPLRGSDVAIRALVACEWEQKALAREND